MHKDQYMNVQHLFLLLKVLWALHQLFIFISEQRDDLSMGTAQPNSAVSNQFVHSQNSFSLLTISFSLLLLLWAMSVIITLSSIRKETIKEKAKHFKIQIEFWFWGGEGWAKLRSWWERIESTSKRKILLFLICLSAKGKQEVWLYSQRHLPLNMRPSLPVIKSHTFLTNFPTAVWNACPRWPI